MDTFQVIKQSRFLLKKSALNIKRKMEALPAKESFDSFVPGQLGVSYKILGQWEKFKEMQQLSQEIEEQLMHGNPQAVENGKKTRSLKKPEHTLLTDCFMRGLFSGLVHPALFCYHVDTLKDVLSKSSLSEKSVNILGRFCGEVSSACGLVYSVSSFYNDPRVILPLGLTLIATNSGCAYQLLCRTISFKFEELDDDSLVGFYKAFKGDLSGAYKIFKEKKDRVRLCMIGDFYLDEAEQNIRKIKEEGFLNQQIMDLLMEKPLHIYTAMHDPTNIPRIASDYLNEGFYESSKELWEKYYSIKDEKKKSVAVGIGAEAKQIYHLDEGVRNKLIKGCEKMCCARYRGRSVKLPYSSRMETGLFKALSLMDKWEGGEDIIYFMLKAYIYRLLGFEKRAKKCESAMNLIEMKRITMEEKANTLKILRKLHVHVTPMDKLKLNKSMEIRGYLTDDAIDFLTR